jgi:hypothetical protein
MLNGNELMRYTEPSVSKFRERKWGQVVPSRIT